MNIISHIEHSFLKPDTTITDIELLCAEASQNSFPAVCVPPMFVKKAKAIISNNKTSVATVIGFPFGYNAIESKIAEVVLAIVDGADELDVMINLVALKSKDWQYLAKEISTILSVTKKAGKKVKAIIEAGILGNEEIIASCDIYGAAGIDFLQTSTGMQSAPVAIEKLKLMRKHLADVIKLKAADPIDNLLLAKEWIAAGANRIVCSDPLQIAMESLDLKDGIVFGNKNAYKN